MKISTVNKEPSIVYNFIASKRPNTYKKKSLPEGYIRRLYASGMGYKKIAKKLKAEKGITASYGTIYRLLTGQRK